MSEHPPVNRRIEPRPTPEQQPAPRSSAPQRQAKTLGWRAFTIAAASALLPDAEHRAQAHKNERTSHARRDIDTTPNTEITEHIRGFHESWRDETLHEYARLFEPDGRPWREAVRRCLRRDRAGHVRYIAPIEEATQLTGNYFPAGYVAGMVVHESRCRADMHTVDGGTGYAQITPYHGHIDARFFREAARLLGHEPDWQNNPTDNIVLGLVQLRMSEEALHSRELGLAAYNAGIQGVRNAMREHGWHEGLPTPSLDQIHPFLPHRPRSYDARFYAAKVLATGMLAERIRRGVPVTRLPHLPATIRLADFPGAGPSIR